MNSVGRILRLARENKKQTIIDVQKHIKIHPTFIKALESDDYNVFDTKVHAKGFLKMYAEYLNLNVEEVMAFWRREHEARFEKENSIMPHQLKNPIKDLKFAVTPSLIFTLSAVVFFIVFTGYLYIQYKSYTGSPRLDLTNPKDNLVTSVEILDVLGNVDIDSDVYVNNQKVDLNVNGDFTADVRLKEGVNTVNISVVNSFGKKTDKLLTIVYRPPDTLDTSESSQSTSTTNVLPLVESEPKITDE